MMAKKLGMKPWEVDRMDATLVDEFITIMSEDRGFE